MIEKSQLEKLYLQDKASMMEIAKFLECSPNKVTYWMDAHNIKRRTISDAIYQKHNPHGDPFKIKKITTTEDAILHGIGIGLYWGEGTKASLYSVRLGNSDPALIRKFMEFLIELYGIEKNDLRFGLQIFTDINPKDALTYWTSELDVQASQFGKLIVTISGSLGTYRKKSQYGVATVMYHNKKLRDVIVGLLPR